MESPLTQKILSSAQKVSGAAVTLRRKLHAVPETAWQEHKTSEILKDFLAERGISFKPMLDTGIVAEIGSGKGKCAAIRSDIDALPINEETDYPFKSTFPGRMHACGHDIHMATVSAAAVMISQLSEQFSGTVKVLFQPAEEEPPGGALKMVKAGALECPKVDMILGLHAWPTIKTGQIGIKDGPLCAGVLDFDVEIIGKGGHGAYPSDTIDPIVCASQMVMSLQTIVSRSVNPFEPAVVTIGKIDGGTARNIIPPRCRLHGTARAQTDKLLKQLKHGIETIVYNTAKSCGAKAEMKYMEGYPPLANVPAANVYLKQAVHDLYGKKAVVSLPYPSMGGEDFAYYLQHAPGAMFLLGVGNPQIGAVYGLHHPKFKADEAAIIVGAGVLTKSVIDFLNA